MDTLPREIEKINPLFSIKYKNYLDRFLSMKVFEMIFIGFILLMYLGLFCFLFFAFSNQDKPVFLFSVFVTSVIMAIFVLPQMAKSYPLKIVFGKDEFMTFDYHRAKRSNGVVTRPSYASYAVFPYSDIKSYTLKPKSILLKIDTAKLGEGLMMNPGYYVGNLTKDEMETCKEILQKHANK